MWSSRSFGGPPPDERLAESDVSQRMRSSSSAIVTISRPSGLNAIERT